MQDRVPLYPGRVKLTPVSGQTNVYDMVRADSPQQEGTALNKNTLLSDAAVAALGLEQSDPTPSDAFKSLARSSLAVILSVGNWSVGSDSRYYQTVAVAGVTTDTKLVIVDAGIDGADRDADIAILNAFSLIANHEAKQGNGTMTFYASSAPEINLPVNVGVM